MLTFSYATGLVQSCGGAFFRCWASKTNKTTLFCTKLTSGDVKVKFPPFHLLLTLRMDFYCHQKYARYLHTLGVKPRSLVEIYRIFFSVRRALKVPFLTSWDIFSSIFWSIFTFFPAFCLEKILKTQPIVRGRIAYDNRSGRDHRKKSFIKKTNGNCPKSQRYPILLFTCTLSYLNTYLLNE